MLGYCILPLTVAMLVCRLVLLAELGPINFMVRLLVVIVMFAWSIVGKSVLIPPVAGQTAKMWRVTFLTKNPQITHGVGKGDYTRPSSVLVCVGCMGSWKNDLGLSLTH